MTSNDNLHDPRDRDLLPLDAKPATAKIRFKRIEFFDDGHSIVSRHVVTAAEWRKNYPREAE